VGRPYGLTLEEKQARLCAALGAHPQTAGFVPEDPAGSPRKLGYRNSAKLVFRRRRVPGPGARVEVLLGVYRPGTHSVMPADGCVVHDPALRPLLRDLRTRVEEAAIPIFDERSRSGDLRYALARSSSHSGRIHLTLVTARPQAPWLDDLSEGLRRRHADLESLFLCVNPTPGNVLLGPEIQPVFGPRALLDRIGDRWLESRPESFVQANPRMAANLYRAAAHALPRGSAATILDLFCGVGAIGLSMARPEDRLIGIETSAGAIECARNNARRAGLRRARFFAAPAHEAEDILAREGIPRADVVVVNPPRKGIGAQTAAMVARLAPARIVYVSCEPESLAGDLARLIDRGYGLDRVRAYDMLPQTPHVEVLASLSARP
jgi:23S rRNA (uracil1939-C5)-methyltransferase